MTGFIGQLISSHTLPAPVIEPRISGLFEPGSISTSLTDNNISTNPDLAAAYQPSVNTKAANEYTLNAPIPASTATNPAIQYYGPVKEEAIPNTFLPEQQPPQHKERDTPGIINQVLHQHLTEQHYHPEQTNYYNLAGNSIQGNEDTAGMNRVIPSTDIADTTNDTGPSVLYQHTEKEIIKETNTGIMPVFTPMPVVQPAMQVAHTADKAIAIPLPQQENTTVIKVSIGRIDVRAITAPATVKKKQSGPATPGISLEEYLNKRNNSGK